MHQFRSAMAWSSNPKRNRACRACFGWVAQVRAPGFWALTWATPTPLPSFRTYLSMISGGGMEGHLNTFPRGGLPCIPSNGAAFGIPKYDGCEAPPPFQRHLTSAHPSSTISTRQLGLLIAGQQPCNQLKLNAIQTKGVYRWLSLPHSTTASWCAV